MSDCLPVLLSDEEAARRLRADFLFPQLTPETKQETKEETKQGTNEGMRRLLYLDHAGAALASSSQLEEVFRSLAAAPMANPHSMGPLGSRSEDIIASCRLKVLQHFGADPSDYDVVFTSGSTSALKLVAECFPWSPTSSLVYPYNSHTSVLGMREFAPSAYCVPSALFHRSSTSPSSTKIDTDANQEEEEESNRNTFYSLLVVPGECNFSGMKMDRPLYDLQPRKSRSCGPKSDVSQPHGLEMDFNWPQEVCGASTVKESEARRRHLSDQRSPSSSGCDNSKSREVFLWMLDASKLATNSVIDICSQGIPHPSPLDRKPSNDNEVLLSRPHFLCVSFYKIFGYPTGVGALLVRRDVVPLLKKRYFGGGTVSGVVASADIVQRPAVVRDAGLAHPLLEDGTLNYHGIAALSAGFNALQRAGGMANIQRFTFQLTHRLYEAMCSLRHEVTGVALCEVYGRHAENSSSAQGSVLTFNLRWADGSYIGFGEVGEKASEDGIQLRVGCFCSIGGCQESLDMSADNILENMKQGRTCQDSSVDLVNGRPTGAVRVSVGYMTDPAYAITRLLDFLRHHFLNKTMPNVSQPASKIYLSSDNEQQESTDPTVFLHSIYVYPIKSCAGFKVKAWPLGSAGLCLDREWAVVNAVTGIALTQKTHPLLSRCVPVIDLELLVMTISPPTSCDLAPLVISLTGDGGDVDEEGSNDNSTLRHVKVCYSQHVAQRCKVSADAWFTTVLGTRCQLVRRGASPMPASFSNSAQFLLLSMSSLRTLKHKMNPNSTESDHVSVESFRPNLVVDRNADRASQNEYSHEEDSWKEVTFPISRWCDEGTSLDGNLQPCPPGSSVTLRSTGPCARCSMVNIVPPTAGTGLHNELDSADSSNNAILKNPKTLKTLSQYRKGQHGAGAGKNDVYFGQYFSYDPTFQKSVEIESTPHPGQSNLYYGLNFICEGTCIGVIEK